MAMSENEAIEVLEKPSKHIRMVHETKNEMQFYTFSSDLVKAFETAIQALEEIQQYRAIGTIEEFKALKEKNELKKPIEVDNWGDYYKCPTCKEYAVDDVGGRYKYCPNCGTKIDWQ